ALAVVGHAGDRGAAALVETVAAWLDGPVAAPEVAVLTRVQSLLLAPHVALATAGIPVDSILDEGVLGRLGVRAALAYLRLALDPEQLDPRDLVEVHRRPSRGLPRWAERWLERCRSVADVRRAAARVDDERVASKLDALAGDLERLARRAAAGASTRELLTAVRDGVGLGSAMTLLDSSGGSAGSHLDDLEALLQVADLQPEAAAFEPWLRRTFQREHDGSGVTLSTIHRVKGREWPYVAVFGVSDGIVPHRLATDVEEERRILHVGITRGVRRVVVLGDAERTSPFLAELDGSAPHDRTLGRRTDEGATSSRPARAPAGPVLDLVRAAPGLALTVLGGYRGTVSALEDDGVRLAVEGGGSVFVRYGERVTVDDRPHALAAPRRPGADEAVEALKAWRRDRSRADGVPAYVVLSDVHLAGIVERWPEDLARLRACPGIGPAKLESYGDEILAVLARTGERSGNSEAP
ncbi:MAG: HRDC domain-containing protein, partial [Acidimicrobiia bacterium]